MAKLQHQNSMAAFEKHHGGCTNSLFQIFNFHLHQQQPSRRLLEHSSHGSNKRTKDPKIYVPLPTQEYENWDSDANFLIVNKSKSKRKSSSSALLKGLSRIFTKKQHQKPKTLTARETQPDAFSGHHLDCSNHVLHEENIRGSGISHLDDNIPLIPNGEGCEICRALDAIDYIKNTQIDKLTAHSTGKESKLNRRFRKTWQTMKKKEPKEKNGDVALASKDFVTMLKLYTAHRDLFEKILGDPGFSFEKFAKDLHSTSSERPFVKSGSFLTEISSRNDRSFKHNHGWIANFNSTGKEGKHNAEQTPKDDDLQAPSFLFGRTVDTQLSKPGARTTYVTDSSSETSNSDSDKHQIQKEDEIALDSIRDIFEDIMNATKEQQRISKDAVMHKIPYGQKISEDVGTPALFRSTSDRSYNDSLRFKPSAASIRYHDRSTRRSRSLSDSLDRYSNLLASITTKEAKRLPETSSSTNEDNSFKYAMNPSPLESTFSNLEKITQKIQHEVFELEPHGSAYEKSVDTFGNREKTMSVITERHSLDTTDGSVADEEQSRVTTKNEQNEECQNIVKAEHQGHAGMHSQTAADLENLLSENEIQQSDSPDTLDSVKSGNKQTMPKHKDGFIFETEDELTPSPISVLDAIIEEEFTPRDLNLELTLLSIRPRKLDFDASDRLEDIESTVADHHAVSSNNIRVLSAKEDYETEFNHVRNIVQKFNFNGVDFVGAGSSEDQAEHLLIGEGYALTNQCSVMSLDTDDAEIYRMLIADLVNEVLSITYKNSVAHPWLSRYGSRCRPFPVGSYLLEEVWEKVSKLLISQTQTVHTVDNILALDFAKKDIWPNLQLSAESLATEIADLIFDHVLEELILEFDDE